MIVIWAKNKKLEHIMSNHTAEKAVEVKKVKLFKIVSQRSSTCQNCGEKIKADTIHLISESSHGKCTGRYCSKECRKASKNKPK